MTSCNGMMSHRGEDDVKMGQPTGTKMDGWIPQHSSMYYHDVYHDCI